MQFHKWQLFGSRSTVCAELVQHCRNNERKMWGKFSLLFMVTLIRIEKSLFCLKWLCNGSFKCLKKKIPLMQRGTIFLKGETCEAFNALLVFCVFWAYSLRFYRCKICTVLKWIRPFKLTHLAHHYNMSRGYFGFTFVQEEKLKISPPS